MRYLDGQVPGATEHAGTPEFVGFTVFLTLVIGVIFVIAGWKGRQIWLASWGALTLVACSLYYLHAVGVVQFS